MRINTNVGALGASRNLFANNQAAESSMRKLSSGLRIARAGDDAAGLAIANRLRTQSRSLVQASNNAQQGNAMLQIAEGAAQTIQRIIERQKELVMQRESGQNTSVTGTLATEITTLQSEATRVKDAATFQGTNVFASFTFQVNDSTTGGSVTVNAGFTLSSLTGSSSLADVDGALTAVNDALAAIGAGQNRLDYTVDSLKSAIVNVRAAESTIRDVDMAEEMANYTKNSVLSQAATAMLGQANQSSQSILSILR